MSYDSQCGKPNMPTSKEDLLYQIPLFILKLHFTVSLTLDISKSES